MGRRERRVARPLGHCRRAWHEDDNDREGGTLAGRRRGSCASETNEQTWTRPRVDSRFGLLRVSWYGTEVETVWHTTTGRRRFGCRLEPAWRRNDCQVARLAGHRKRSLAVSACRSKVDGF